MTAPVLANASVKAALAEAHERYGAANRKSQKQYEKACAAFPGGNTRTALFYAPFPLTLVKGEGAYLWDADGHEYIDFLGEYSAGLFGHSDPVIRAALDRALDRGIDLGGHNTLEAKLGAAICARFPAIELVRFTNSGTEANLMAISAARAIIKRPRIMVFEGGYHGGVFHFPPGGSPINAPFDFVVARYNDTDGTVALIDQIGSDLAAVVVEPMMGNGGCIPADKTFLQALRDATQRHGVLLIFDEVMSSRLSPGGLQETYGVIPDMTTLGKYLGGGMSFGAFGGRADLMAHFDARRPDAFRHAGTFNNNVLTMSAGLAALSIYTPEAARRHNARGDALRDQLNALAREKDANMQVTGMGSMLNVHMRREPIRSPADVAKQDFDLRELFFFDLVEQGIWLARRGMAAVSLAISEADYDRLVAAVEEFIVQRRSLVSG
jgi:glutamate-1-semialdehyde 2,1-aminomutase